MTTSRARVRRRLLAGVRVHAVARVSQLLAGVGLLPWMLAHLSTAEYGLWGWLFGATAWVALADAGLSQANVRPLAAALAEGAAEAVGKVLTAAIGLHLLLGGLVASGLWFARGAFEAAAPGAPVADTLAPLLLAQMALVTSFPFGALLNALQRMDVVHWIRVAQIAGLVVGTIAVLAFGGGVPQLAQLHAGLACGELIARVLACRRCYPRLRLAVPPSAELPALLSVGGPLVVLSVFAAIASGFERFALGFFANLEAVALYSIGFRLVMLARELPFVLLYSMIPASAALDVAGDEEGIARLGARGWRVAALIVPTVVVAVALVAPPLVRAWVGPGFEDAARVAAPIAIGMIVPMLAVPGLHILIGRGRLALLTPTYALWSLAFVVGNGLWLAAVGFAGAGWGVAVVNGLGTAWLLRRFQSPGVPVPAVDFGLLARSTLAALLAAAVLAALDSFVPEGLGRWLELLHAAGLGLALTTVVGALLWCSGTVGEADRRLIADFFRRAQGSPPG